VLKMSKLAKYLRTADYSAIANDAKILFSEKSVPKQYGGIFRPYDNLKAIFPNASGNTNQSLLVHIIPGEVAHFKSYKSAAWARFLTDLTKYIQAYSNPNSTSVINSVSKLRKLVKSNMISPSQRELDSVHKYMNVWSETKARDKQYVSDLKDKRAHQLEIADVEIYDVLDKITQRLENNRADFYDAALAIELATGMRFNETVDNHTTTFSESKNGPRWITVHGVSKKGDSHTTEGKNAPSIDKPIVGLTSSDILKLWAIATAFIDSWVKRSITSNPRDSITNTFNKGVNARIRELFGRDDITSHVLRAAYGNLSYELYAPHTYDRSAWLSKYLQHTSATTALSYQKVTITDSL